MYQDKLVNQNIPFEEGPVEILEVIKKTAYSSICLGKDVDGTKVVLKYIPYYTNPSREYFNRELSMFQLIGTHPNIVSFFDESKIPGEIPIGVLKLEYCSLGNLRDFVNTHRIDEAQAFFIIQQIVLGVVKIQDQGIIHRNLCPDNILVTSDYQFKICDFGSAVRFDETKNLDYMVLKIGIEKTSNPRYRPPGVDMTKFDLYSIGCVLYFIVFKKEYEPGTNYEGISNKITGALRACLSPLESRMFAREFLAILNSLDIPQFIQDDWVPEAQEVEYSKIGSKFCLDACLEVDVECPDAYYLQYLLLKTWNVPTVINKVYSYLMSTERVVTVKCIKILILVHRLLISGPSEGVLMTPGPKSVLETMLQEWTNKVKHFQDEYHCDYFCGFIRQMCRILLDKVEIHFKTATLGNWKQAVRAEFVQPTIEYFKKCIMVCDLLVRGATDLPKLMNFFTLQILEECQRLKALLTQIIPPENASMHGLANAIERIDAINNGFSNKLSVEPQKPHEVPYASNPMPQPRASNLTDKIPEHYPSNPGVPQFQQAEVTHFASTMPSHVPPKPKDIIGKWLIKPEQISIKNVLGSGASCTVYRGYFKRTPVAIKVVRSNSMETLEKEFEREVRAMVVLRHPNLVLFMGACHEPQMIIVSEFCAGESLFKLLHERKDVMLSWTQRMKMIKDIARGMLYLHDNDPPIMHRDLKSLNLLLAEEVKSPNDRVCVKITDFGVAKIMDRHSTRDSGPIGTCHWIAPEVFNSEPYTAAADVYSFAIVVYEIVTREIPYKNIHQYLIPMKVMSGERPSLGGIPTTCPELLKDIMRACWHPSPEQRPSFLAIIDQLDTLSDYAHL